MKKKYTLLLTIAALIVVIVLGVLGYRWLTDTVEPTQPQSQQQTEKEPVPAPDFMMTDKDGQTVRLSDYFGKPIVLNFWASWCPPCKSEMPHFNKAYEELKDEITFLMVDSVDGQRETVETGMEFIEDSGYTFPVFFDTKQEGAYSYGVSALPTTLFIDRDGNVVVGYQQALTEKALRNGIEKIR